VVEGRAGGAGRAEVSVQRAPVGSGADGRRQPSWSPATPTAAVHPWAPPATVPTAPAAALPSAVRRPPDPRPDARPPDARPPDARPPDARPPDAPPALQRLADPVGAALAAGLARPDGDGSIVFLPPVGGGGPGDRWAAEAADPGWSAAPGRTLAAPLPVRATRPHARTTERAPVVVQRLDAPAGASVTGPATAEPVTVARDAADADVVGVSATAAGGTAGGTAAAGEAPAVTAATAPPPAPPPAPPDIDELVRRLYEPLSARLRAELRLDRERAGVVTDLQHR
jgi:hypothetical protein